MATPEEPRRLRILFSMRNFWFVKLYESVLRELAARGHQVHILADGQGGPDAAVSGPWQRAVTTLADECPGITFSLAPRTEEDIWIDLRMMVRFGLDYIRYLDPVYAGAPILEARAVGRTPPGIVRLSRTRLARTAIGRRLLGGALRTLERAIPIDRAQLEAITAHRPDVLLITPLVTLGSDQQDSLRAARQRGIPSALCVGSWDHLSSKALIRTVPDRIFVWNETQKREALTLHRVPAERVAITGAQCFDQWFDRRPSRSRQEFCRRVGLDPGRPFVAYVCSALFEGTAVEAEFVRDWIAAVRAHPALRDVGILVRPHPKRGQEWNGVDLAAVPNAVLWPPVAAAPFDAESKSDYFDSLFHSGAVVGLNTSALIEGGIVGRPVLTVLLPQLRDNQEGTLHFHYLLDGGLLMASRTMAGHIEQLAECVAGEGAAVTVANRNSAFIEQFVRPRGLAVAATPVLADGIEQLAALASEPAGEPLWVAGLRVALRPLAHQTRGRFVERIARQRRFRAKEEERIARAAALSRQRAAEHARTLAARAARHAAEQRQREERLAQRRAAKQRAMAQKAEQQAARRRERQRQKRRQTVRARLARLYQRVVARASASR